LRKVQCYPNPHFVRHARSVGYAEQKKKGYINMGLFRTIGTAAAAIAVTVSVPVSAASAAVRPGSAVPAASANSVAASAAQGGNSASTPWAAYAAILATLIAGGWIAFSDDKSDSLSRG